MAPPSATSCLMLAACVLFLRLSFLTHHVAAASPPLFFSFNFSNTSNYRLQDLEFQGNAVLNGKLVDLTPNPADYYNSGRMWYNHPVPLYDNITGEVASFTTTFTFAIKLLPKTTGEEKGDGMAFFLSGYPSRLPPDSAGNLLGLTNDSETTASGADRFVAVEFDTYGSDQWDPTGSSDHIGIDLNSITSVVTSRLQRYSLNGTMTATITFDNTTRTLEATLYFDAARSLPSASVKTQLPDPLDALLPPEVAVGFSAATGTYTELHQIHSWSFSSTMAARDTTGANRVHPEQGQVLDNKGRHGSALIIGGVVIVILVVLLLLGIWPIMSWYRWKRWKRTYDSFGMGCRLKRFKYHDLSIATNRFSNKNKIGEGGFGVVYRGTLEKKDVAVKKILKDSRGNFKDFFAELGAISGAGHVNVVSLEGWCCRIGSYISWCLNRKNIELFLVYELVPNGNLHEHLHERPEVLSWARRYKIVKGLLSALHYLHYECKPYILHRDIKPSNILLDKEFNAKLGDFGLSRVFHDIGEKSAPMTLAIGTVAYMPPECQKHGLVKLLPSSDVYSFGIVLLEIAHGNNDPNLVRKMRTDRPRTFVKDIADKKLVGQFDKAEMERVIDLGLWCSEKDENQRPSLTGAILQFLDNGGELPLPQPVNPT